MYRLRFHLNLNNALQLKAYQSIQHFEPKFRAGAVRHAFLVASLVYGDDLPDKVLSLSGIDVRGFDESLNSNRDRYKALDLRWPVNSPASGKLSEVCEKAYMLRPSAKSIYLTTLYMLGMDILDGNKPLIHANSEEVIKVVKTEQTKPEAIKINPVKNQSDAKSSLKSLMKRSQR